MSKKDTDIKIGGRFWSTSAEGKIIDASQIDGLDGALEINLENGIGSGGVEQKDAVYNGEPTVFSDGTKGVQTGDTVPGAEAKGFQSFAIGGVRYNYYTSPETHAENLIIDSTSIENWGRTPTSAEGNQSFAGGASCHAYGDWDIAFGHDSKTYQLDAFAFGGGLQTGFTEAEFNAYFWDAEKGVALHSGRGKNANGEILDQSGKVWKQSYSASITAGMGSKNYGWNSAVFGNGNTVYGKFHLIAGATNIVGKTESKTVGSVLGCGEGNTIEASYNIFNGQKNKVYGALNTINGANNTVSGSANAVFGENINVSGGHNLISGATHDVSGNYSLVSGSGNKVSYNSSAAIGQGLIVGTAAQIVVGLNNEENNLARFVVGVGADKDNPSNGFWVDTDGRCYGKYTSHSQDNELTSKAYVDNKISTLIGAAPETLNTLEEIASWIEEDKTGTAALVEQVNSKVSDVQVNGASIVANNIANIRVNAVYGTGFSSGYFAIAPATEAEVRAKQSNRKPIVPAQIDLALVHSLGKNSKSNEMTAEMRANARNLIGLVAATTTEIDALFA